MSRPVKKRGRKSKLQQCTNSSLAMTQGEEARPDIRSPPIISRLLRIYRDTMYQCYFPFLPERDLLSRWTDGIPDSDLPSYMLLMALCAVSSQTAASNAVFDTNLLVNVSIPDSEQYFKEAVSKIPTRIAQSHDLDYLRSFGLMSVYALHENDYSNLQRYLGLYHALVAQHSFHDESRWPIDISLSEVDERRRLFWCVYRLEIHSACILGHIIRMPEAQVSVQYPRITPAMNDETQAWTDGWSYITDLFRLLEYAIVSLRGCQNRKPTLSVFYARPTPTVLLDGLARIKSTKPRMLLGLHTFESDRCKYMAVQITCIEALVGIMALLYAQAPISEIMDIAERFLQVVTGAELILFKVAGSQIVHQLLGVGHMVHNASRCDDSGYASEARRLIAFLGDLVTNLSGDIPFAAIAGERLTRLAGAVA